MYRIGVISDTHGLLRPEIKEQLNNTDAIFHAGDIDRPEILENLRTIASVYAVRGNTDREWASALPETVKIELYGLRIFMIHNKKQIAEDISDRDIIISGHSHKYEEHLTGGEKRQLWLNPGSCGPRRFTLPVTMALVETDGSGDYQVQKVVISQSDDWKREIIPDPVMQKTMGVDGDSRQIMQENEAKQLTAPVVNAIIRDLNAGKSISAIAKKNKLSLDLIEFICRLFLTHPGVDANGILDKLNIRNR